MAQENQLLSVIMRVQQKVIVLQLVQNAKTAEQLSVAIGFNANATGLHAVAIGPNATTGTNAWSTIAIGNNANATLRHGVAIGDNATTRVI